MEQITSAIEIFEAAHPDCQALFVFDQSSTHASLPDNALKAFEMNKSNGGVQCRQHDTIIPDSNPDPRLRSQPQAMTTATGEQKGLQAVLENVALMFQGSKPNANQSACLKAKIAAWPGSSLSRKIL